MNSPEYVFVLSMPRSGSTLFTRLLNNLDQCVSLPETHFLVFYDNNRRLSFEKSKEMIIHNWINFYRTKKWISNLDLLSDELTENANSYEELFNLTVKRYLYENKIAHPKKIIEKSPPHIFFQNDIRKIFQNVEAIYLIRDPRSVAGSMLGMSWSTHNIYTIARSWKKSTQEFKKIKPNITLRYEDLIAKKDEVISEIQTLFGIQINKDRFFQNDTDISGMNEWYHRNLKNKINDEFIHKWKNQLSHSDCETEIIEFVCKPYMAKYDYERTTQRNTLKMYCMMFLGICHLAVQKVFKKITNID